MQGRFPPTAAAAAKEDRRNDGRKRSGRIRTHHKQNLSGWGIVSVFEWGTRGHRVLLERKRGGGGNDADPTKKSSFRMNLCSTWIVEFVLFHRETWKVSEQRPNMQRTSQ
jgi:hypothetical protein